MVQHLFLLCPEVQNVWLEVPSLIILRATWEGPSLLEAFKSWWDSEVTKLHRIIPLIISWVIWITRNSLIFEDRRSSNLDIASKAAGIILFFSDGEKPPRAREVSAEAINKELPWGYFDGAVEGDPSRCGASIVLHLDVRNSIKCKEGLGSSTNNFAETSALRLLLIMALEWGVHLLQVFGDSKIVIDWADGTSRCGITRLSPILDEIFILKNHFDFISLSRIYRERNSIADGLSKEGAQLPEAEERS